MTFSPRFSPDGQRVIMSLQQGGNSNIFAMDLRSKATTRLTDTAAIDTAPSYSPDGARICFESDRGGTPADLRHERERRRGAAHQLRRRLVLDAGVVAARRLHRLHQAGRRASSRIGVMKPDGSGERMLTEGYPQRRPDLGAERPRADVLPRSGRQRRPVALSRSTSPAATSSGSRRRLRVRSGLVAAAVVSDSGEARSRLELAVPLSRRVHHRINHSESVYAVVVTFRGSRQGLIKVDGTFA